MPALNREHSIYLFYCYTSLMELEHRVEKIEGDLKELRERVSRHSARINTLEQNQLQEKGEITELKSEVRTMDNTLQSIKENQEDMRDELQNIQTNMTKNFRKYFICMLAILIVIFWKDSSTGTKIANILALLTKTI